MTGNLRHAWLGRAVPWLTALALFLGGGMAAGEEPAVKKEAGEYTSGGQKIGVTRYAPAGPGPHPALLLLHGSDGADKNGAAYAAMAGRLAAQGYAVFVVRYFDCFAERPRELAFFQDNVAEYCKPGAAANPDRLKRGFEDCLAVVCDGVKYARAQRGVDGERVGLVGFSLGAFLALSAATREDLKVSAVIDLFGGLPEELHKAAKALPPVLILHGERDKVVPAEAAQTLAKTLAGHKIPHEIKVYGGVGHVFEREGGGLCLPAALDAELRAAEFLRKHLKAPPADK